MNIVWMSMRLSQNLRFIKDFYYHILLICWLMWSFTFKDYWKRQVLFIFDIVFKNTHLKSKYCGSHLVHLKTQWYFQKDRHYYRSSIMLTTNYDKLEPCTKSNKNGLIKMIQSSANLILWNQFHFTNGPKSNFSSFTWHSRLILTSNSSYIHIIKQISLSMTFGLGLDVKP